jgi:hypothetical protein
MYRLVKIKRRKPYVIHAAYLISSLYHPFLLLLSVYLFVPGLHRIISSLFLLHSQVLKGHSTSHISVGFFFIEERVSEASFSFSHSDK